MSRPDVGAVYADEPHALWSGFRIELIAVACQPVSLDWLDETGNWHEFWRKEPSEAESRRLLSTTRPVLSAARTRALLDAIASETATLDWRQASRKARELILDFTGRSTPLQSYPNLFAHLDEPAGESCAGRFLPVRGWIFNSASPVKRVFICADPAGSVYVIFPKPRPDVASAHPHEPVPPKCGFEAMIMLPTRPPACLHLRIYAEFADGTTTLAIYRRFFFSHEISGKSAQIRSAILMGALVFAGIYRPQYWSNWMKALLTRNLANQSDTGARKNSVTHLRPDYCIAPAAEKPVATPRASDPLISILVPVFNTPERYLREMIDSVQAQTYPRWELCLADDASTLPHVRQLLADSARNDSRVHVIYRPKNGHISRATNSALTHAKGEFVALLDHDDLLAPDALRRVVEAIGTQPDAHFFYTNRDKIDDHGRHFDPENRGAWNPAMATTHNYLHHFTVIRRSIVLLAGAFRADYFGSQDLDLYLRCHELLQSGQIVYIPFVAYHWRAHAGSTASRGDQKDYMFDSARRAIEDALKRRGLRASPFLPDFGPFFGMNLHQLRWDAAILRDNPVSIVVAVPFSLRKEWRRCVDRLRDSVPADSVQMIVAIAGEPDEPLEGRTEIDAEWVIASTHAQLAELYNLGAALARNPLLLMLEASVIPGAAGWLEDLAGWLGVPGVAAAGPKLIGADGLLASAGWTIDQKNKLPLPLFAGDAVTDLLPPFLAHSARDALLIDPACVLTRTAVFRAFDGYDHRHFPGHFFAADFCLRLHAQYHRVIFTPQAVLRTCRANPAPFDEGEIFAFRKHHPDPADPWICPVPLATISIEQARKDWMPAATVEFPSGWFFLEQPYQGEEVRAGHQMLSGWCFAHPDKTIAELRIHLNGQPQLANLGEPRPDLAAMAAPGDQLFPAGFSLELELPSGRFQLEFEAYVTGSGWERICILDLNVRPCRAATKPMPAAPITAAHFMDSLEVLVKKTAGPPGKLLRSCSDDFAREASKQRRKRHPARPFHGYIDRPSPDIEPFYSEINVFGWLFHETQPIRRVVASFHLSNWIELQHQEELPAIAPNFPGNPRASRCGLFGRVPVPQDRPQPLSLRIWAELTDGSWHLVFILRCRMHTLGLTDLGTLRGMTAWELAQSALSLRLAYFRRGVQGPSWLSLWPVVTAVRRRIPTRIRKPTSQIVTSSALKPVTPRLLMVSHNLNREGAPLFLLELAQYCREQLEVPLTVVSTLEGSLRTDFEQLGANVRIIDRLELWSARTPEETNTALNRMAAELGASEASLVIANTVESFWAVTAALRIGRRSLFYIHEPAVLGVHYLNQSSVAVRRQAGVALAQASCVSFLNRATRAYYLKYSTGSNYRIQPGWTQLSPCSTRLAPTVRDQLRSRLGFTKHERVVINVGSVCPRKGQLFFIQAIEHLCRTSPALAASCRFLLIGAHDNPYAIGLRTLLTQTGLTNVELLPPTNRVHEYFSVADLFVLSSFEEGFSRVLLEAMAFELPIVSTAIHGIPEITRDGVEALLAPAGDAPAMAAAMQRLLQNKPLASRVGRAARARLEATFTAERVIPQHIATIMELAPELVPALPKSPASAVKDAIRAAI
ncbi:MAG TPA: glycosyltransferase [Lacunisphaera sp.]